MHGSNLFILKLKKFIKKMCGGIFSFLKLAGNVSGIKEVLNKRDKMHHCSKLVKMFVESNTVRLPTKALLFKISFNLIVICRLIFNF